MSPVLQHIMLYPTSIVPTVGASGAIAAVLGANLLFFPHRRVVTLIPLGLFIQIARVPAVIVLGVWFLLQLFEGTLALGMTQVGGVAFWAHIGGFVFGMIIGPRLRQRQQPALYFNELESLVALFTFLLLRINFFQTFNFYNPDVPRNYAWNSGFLFIGVKL